jgi:hypothetical protein
MPSYVVVIFDNDNREIIENGRHLTESLQQGTVPMFARVSLTGLEIGLNILPPELRPSQNCSRDYAPKKTIAYKAENRPRRSGEHHHPKRGRLGCLLEFQRFRVKTQGPHMVKRGRAAEDRSLV